MDKNLKRMATMHRMQVAGLELFYKNGYYNTSIDEILKSLSLSKGAFYYHFQSKEDFFVSIVQNLIVRKVYSMLIEPIEGKENPFPVIEKCFEKFNENCNENFLETCNENFIEKVKTDLIVRKYGYDLEGKIIISKFPSLCYCPSGEVISNSEFYKIWEEVEEGLYRIKPERVYLNKEEFEELVAKSKSKEESS
jgi:hypothetical protein